MLQQVPQSDHRGSGWQGVSLVAITYVYFLIFPQFAFLKRLTAWGVAGTAFNAVMATMAIGGILFSLISLRIGICGAPVLRLRIGLCLCGTAAFATLLPLSLASCLSVSFFIGAGLGLLTVTLVTHLRHWMGARNTLLKVGVGTGTGYFVCNIPIVFSASPTHQAAFAGMFCVIGFLLTLGQMPVAPVASAMKNKGTASLRGIPLVAIVGSFAALIWLDSAAFFIIQNSPLLKSGTWAGDTHLWLNAFLHLAAALVSAWLLGKRGASFVLPAAFVALGGACLLMANPGNLSLASVAYPIGVSFYSVALVAYPSLLSLAQSDAARGREAGWIYAIAGWIGSAVGIGMAQSLGHVPLAFVCIAGAVVLLPPALGTGLLRKREFALPLLLLVVAYPISRVLASEGQSTPHSQVERGRAIYISEGCINCHSQYVRPSSPDVLMWGPVKSAEEVHLQRPPLIGNRRQGPDLSQVGLRRSALWLKMHFYDPREVSGASVMPSYGFLFRDQRGDDLVAYLVSLRGPGDQAHLDEESAWRPSKEAIDAADAKTGEQLFHRFCSTCHDAGGETRWQGHFKRLPPDLTVGPYLHLRPSQGSAENLAHIAQIARFGVPGTDMPGHEYLSENELASLSLWLSQKIAQPSQITSFARP